ncbi:MAG: peptidase M28, partial [Verrucomicrobiota bacterium]
SMGSAVHAKELREKGINVRGVVILEMIGCFSDGWMSQDFPFPLLRLFYPSRGNYIAVVGRLDQWPFMRELKKNMQGATGLPVYSINAPASLPGVDFSDHLNYWETGCNAVMVTDTSFYRNHDYHDEGDVWSRLDYKRMAEVVVAVYEGIKKM